MRRNWSGRGKGSTRWAVIQRSEPPQSRLLGQISIFSNYFWSIELGWFRATIKPPKVCGVVSAQKSIRAGKDGGSWKIEPSTPSISPNAFAESNLHLFPWFLDRWSRLDRLDNSCHRKYRARARLGGVRVGWRIDREWDDESTCQANRRRGGLRASPQRWRSKIRGRFNKITSVQKMMNL